MMGYAWGSPLFQSSGLFGPGHGQPIWLRGTTCYGSEEEIQECEYGTPRALTEDDDAQEFCNHSHDVGLKCLSGGLHGLVGRMACWAAWLAGTL